MHATMDKVNVRLHSSIGVLSQQLVWVSDKSERHRRAKTLLAQAPKLLRFNNIRLPTASAGSVFDGHAG